MGLLGWSVQGLVAPLPGGDEAAQPVTFLPSCYRHNTSSTQRPSIILSFYHTITNLTHLQSDPTMIKDIIDTVSLPVMAKVRIGHFVEAQILQAIGVDYIDGEFPYLGFSGWGFRRAVRMRRAGIGIDASRLDEAGGGFEIETNREAAMMVRSTYHLGKKCRDSRSALPHLCLSRD